jgi:hypothetical protein
VEGELFLHDMILSFSAVVMVVVMVLIYDQGTHVELPMARVKLI